MKKIAIISGEPNSINSELIYKSLKKIKKNIKNKIYLISNYKLLNFQLKKLKYNLKILKLCTLGKLPKKLRLVLAYCNSKNSFFFKKCPFLMKNYHYLIIESDSHKINHLICTLTANISCAITHFLGPIPLCFRPSL